MKRNITAAWATTGLFPFNPDRVLRAISKPLPESTILRADEIEVGLLVLEVLYKGIICIESCATAE